MRTVIVTPFALTLDSGRARRTYGLVRALAALGPVDVVYGEFGAARPDPEYLQIHGVSLHGIERPARAARAGVYLRARLAGVPDDFARGIWPGLAARGAELAGDPGTRLVAEGPVAGAALLPVAARRPAIYSAQNLESAFRHRFEGTRMSRRVLERFERRLLERYAESWMVSEADLDGARALCPSARLRLAPNVLDVEAIAPVPPRTGERSVLFLADFRYEPNRGALRFLLEDAMPALWAETPDVGLVVAGLDSDRLRAPDERVTFAGFVDELHDLYAAAGCAAVPLLEGGGSPLKFVEALAHRVPVVATPRAASGLRAEAGVHYFEGAPEGRAFAAALRRALDPELANPVAAAGRHLAEREYSVQTLSARLAS
jgi:glycosyltransferase involved in cell wall biosynthesis